MPPTLAQNVNGSCRQYKRGHGDEREDRRSPADDFAVVIELEPEEHHTRLRDLLQINSRVRAAALIVANDETAPELSNAPRFVTGRVEPALCHSASNLAKAPTWQAAQ